MSTAGAIFVEGHFGAATASETTSGGGGDGIETCAQAVGLFYWRATLVLASVWLASVAGSQRAVYYPIELSRMATGVYSYWTLLGGLAWLCAGSVTVRSVDHVGAAGLLLLAAVHDERSWSVHMIGVALFAAAALYDAAQRALWLPFVGVALFGARTVLRTVAVVEWEFAGRLRPAQWTWLFAWHHSQWLMFTARFLSPRTLHVYRACAVLQWVSLAMLATSLATSRCVGGGGGGGGQ